ncbi:MAG: sigma-70 family RNA polymerase sigma factor [Pseudomonadota bacterium]
MADGADAQLEDGQLAALIEGVREGDQTAFGELYDRTAALLYGTLRHMLESPAEAEDVLQDVYVSVWLKAGDYTVERGRVLTWLRSIARYRAIDVIRQRRRERPLVDNELERLGDATEPMPSGDERKLALCLGELSLDQRNSIQLAYQRGCTHQEVAATLAMPLGTVKSWIRRALGALKRCMDR